MPLFFHRAHRVQPTSSVISQPPPSTSLEARSNYYGHLSARLSQMNVSAQQFVYFSGLIAAAIVSAGLVGNKPLIVILAPYALTFVITYQLQLYTDVERLITLKENLEGELNDHLTSQVYLEPLALSPKYRSRPSIRLLQIIYIALLIGTFIQSVRTSYKSQARWTSEILHHLDLHTVNLHYINVAGISFCAILLAVAARELAIAHNRTLRDIGKPPLKRSLFARLQSLWPWNKSSKVPQQ
jgi:hypothetical protein